MPRPRGQLTRQAASGQATGVIREPRCKICKSTVRDRVDRLAAAGYGPMAIADQITGLDTTLSAKKESLRKCVERHINKHLYIRDKAMRQILENRAREAGILVDETITQFSNAEAFLDLIVRQGQEQMANPNTIVAYKDVLEAIKIRKENERDNFAIQLDIYERQVRSISQAVKEIVAADVYPQIAERARQIFDGQDEPFIELKELKELV